MAETVFVTGATGYIAKHLVAKLLNAGYRVVGSARSVERTGEIREAVAPVLDDPAALENLRVVALDLDKDAGWSDAMGGTDALFHTASPFPLAQPKDENAIIQSAVAGTRRALAAARDNDIRRVILTSSSGAVTQSELPPGRAVYTEEDWSDPAHPGATPYFKSKLFAERAAWEFVRRDAPDIELTVINPTFVLGPPLDRNYGTSIRVIERILRAKDPMLPRVGFSSVDVRDVAEAHLRALSAPESIGKRILLCDRFLWFSDIAAAIKTAYPDHRIVTRVAPDVLVRFLGLFDPAIRTITPSLGRREEVSADRARALLGLDFADIRDGVVDAATFLIDEGIVT